LFCCNLFTSHDKLFKVILLLPCSFTWKFRTVRTNVLCIISVSDYAFKACVILMPIPVAARSKAWGCACSLAGRASSIPPGAWMPVVSVVSLRRADHSPRGVLPSVAYPSVISKPHQQGDLGPLRLSSNEK